jgi:hypothetical protein
MPSTTVFIPFVLAQKEPKSQVKTKLPPALPDAKNFQSK